MRYREVNFSSRSLPGQSKKARALLAPFLVKGKPVVTVRPIGNKWKLLYNKERRFTDFIRAVPVIGKKVLTDHLRALENDGLIEREVFAEIPPRAVYFLSGPGNSLRPIIM